MTFQTEVQSDMTVRITGRDQVTGADIGKLNSLFEAVEALGGVVTVPTEPTELIEITDVSIDPNAVIYEDASNASTIQLNVTPANANQQLTVTNISTNAALSTFEYDPVNRVISAQGQYADRSATILVAWDGGSKEFTIHVVSQVFEVS